VKVVNEERLKNEVEEKESISNGPDFWENAV
jgi:hypothetical protein